MHLRLKTWDVMYNDIDRMYNRSEHWNKTSEETQLDNKTAINVFETKQVAIDSND